MNFLKCVQGTVINTDYKSVLEVCEPRVEGKLYIRPKFKRVRTPWRLSISLFKDYKPDSDVRTNLSAYLSQELLGECFEFDWSCLRLPKMSEKEEKEVKEVMRAGYKCM